MEAPSEEVDAKGLLGPNILEEVRTVASFRSCTDRLMIPCTKKRIRKSPERFVFKAQNEMNGDNEQSGHYNVVTHTISIFFKDIETVSSSSKHDSQTPIDSTIKQSRLGSVAGVWKSKGLVER